MVEILIAISVLGFLTVATISLLNPRAQLGKGRDATRRSDLNQYRIALEAYSVVNHGVYPDHDTAVVANSTSGTDLCDDLSPNYMEACPVDPLNRDTYIYYYISDADGYDAALYVGLEAEEDHYWVVCVSGVSGEVTDADSPPDGIGDDIAAFCGI